MSAEQHPDGQAPSPACPEAAAAAAAAAAGGGACAAASASCRMCKIPSGGSQDDGHSSVVTTHMPLSTDVPQHCQLAIEMIADLHCPWCFIGLRVLQRALDSVPTCVRRTFRITPFQLGGCPESTTCKRSYMVSQYGEGKFECMLKTFQTLGVSLGIQFNRDGKIGPVGHAYRLARLASDSGKAIECWDMLFQAYFERNLDVSDLDVLAQIGTALDLPDVRSFLESTHYAQDVEAALKVDRGIRGVPHFVINNRLHLAGAQPLGQFLAAFKRLGIPRVSDPDAAPGSCGAQQPVAGVAGGPCGG